MLNRSTSRGAKVAFHLAIPLLASLVASPAHAGDSELGDRVEQAAKDLPRHLLESAGIDSLALDVLFGTPPEEKAIQYDKIADMVILEVKEEAFKTAMNRYGERVARESAFVATFREDWSQADAAAKKGKAAELDRHLTELSKISDDLWGNYPVRGVDLFTLVNTQRLGMIALVAHDRDPSYLFTLGQLQTESLRLSNDIQSLASREAVLDRALRCERGKVVAHLNKTWTLTGDVGEHCSSTRTSLFRSLLVGSSATTDTVAENIIKNLSWYSASVVNVDGTRIYKCDKGKDAEDEAASQCQDLADDWDTDSKALMAAVDARIASMQVMSAAWFDLGEAAVAAMRIPSTDQGPPSQAFTLTNQSKHPIEVKMHTGVASGQVVGATVAGPGVKLVGANPVAPGGTWSMPAGQLRTSHWFGIYERHQEGRDCSHEYDVAGNKVDAVRMYAEDSLGCRSRLVCNFSVAEGDLTLRSTRSAEACHQEVAWVRDEQAYEIAEHIMQPDASGKPEFWSKQTPDQCRRICEEDSSCVMIRLGGIQDDNGMEECLLGSERGPLASSLSPDMSSWRIVSRHGNFVLKNN